MSRLFTSGFEVGYGGTSAAALAGEDATIVYDATAGDTISFDTTIKYSGARSLKVIAPSATTFQVHWPFTAVLTRTYHARIACYFTNFPNAALAYPLDVQDGTHGCEISISSTGVLTCANGSNDAAIAGISTFQALVNTWYVLEIAYCPSTGAASMRVNGVSQGSGTCETSASTSFQLGFNIQNVMTTYVDDWALNDDQGSANTSWCGSGNQVVLLLPAADSASTGFVEGAGGTGSLFAAVDNTPPVGVVQSSATNTSQIKDNTSNTTDNYQPTLQSYTAAGVTGTVVCAQGICNRATSGTVVMSQGLQVVSNPAIAETTSNSPAAAGGTFPTNWTALKTANADAPTVTLASAPVMEFRRGTASTDYAMADLIGLYVEFTPGAAPPLVPSALPDILPRNTLRRGVRNRGQMALFLGRVPRIPVLGAVVAGAATADTSLSADSLSTVTALPRALADTSLTADALPPTISLYFESADTSVSSDALTRSAQALARSSADTSASTDSFTRVLRLVRSTTDTSATSESLTAQKGFSRNLANTSLASDALTRSAQPLARANTNTSVSSDSLSRVVGSPRSLANTSHTTNALTGTAGHPRSFADTSSSDDFLTHIAGLSRPIADTSLTSDSMTASLSSSGTFSRSTADASATTDSLAHVAQFLRATADTSIITDALAGVARYPRPLADTSHSSGVLTRITGLPRVVGDSSTTNDSLTRSARSVRSSTDTSLTLDSMTGVQGGGSGPPRICLPTLASIVPYSTGASSSYSSLEAIVAYASLEAIVAYASLEAVVGGYSSFEAITGGYSSFETMTGYASHETIVTYQSLAALQTYASNAPLSACSGG